MPGRWTLPEISALLRRKKQVAEMGSSEVNRELLNAGYSNAPMRERLSTIERKRVLLAKTGVCDSCQGSGAVMGTEMLTCKHCNGAGKVHETSNSFFGTVTMVPDFFLEVHALEFLQVGAALVGLHALQGNGGRDVQDKGEAWHREALVQVHDFLHGNALRGLVSKGSILVAVAYHDFSGDEGRQQLLFDVLPAVPHVQVQELAGIRFGIGFRLQEFPDFVAEQAIGWLGGQQQPVLVKALF